MRRTINLFLGVGLLLTAMVITASAQEATPASEPMGPPDVFEIAPGVTADSAVFVEGQEAPSLYRLNFAPGVTYPIAPSTNLELVYVETGILVVELDAATTVSQLDTPDAPGLPVPAGTEFTVSIGEYFVLPPGAAGVVRNEGDYTATVSVAGIAPGVSATPEAATPAG